MKDSRQDRYTKKTVDRTGTLKDSRQEVTLNDSRQDRYIKRQ